MCRSPCALKTFLFPLCWFPSPSVALNYIELGHLSSTKNINFSGCLRWSVHAIESRGINTSKLTLGHIKCYASNLKSIPERVLWYNSKEQVYTEQSSQCCGYWPALYRYIYYLKTQTTPKVKWSLWWICVSYFILMLQCFQKNEDILFSSHNMNANLLILIFASQKSDTSAATEGRFYFFGNICLCTCTEL